MKALTVILLVAVVVELVCAQEDVEDQLLFKELKEVLERGLKKNFKGTVKNRKNRSDKNMACPRPQTGMYTEREEKNCKRDRQCGSGEKCCSWFDRKHCLKGLSKARKPGQCPKITQINDACLADYVPCRYDSECHGEDQKCCMNTNCGFKECLSTRQNIACPLPKTYFATQKDEKSCSKDVECKLDEKCCDWSGSHHCLAGVSTIPKPGFCPVPVDTPKSKCIADFNGCDYDSECSGVNDKCCTNPDCGYRECLDINRDFFCPAMEIEVIAGGLLNKPSSCSPTDSGCGFSKLCCATSKDNRDEPIYECVEGIYHPPSPGQCPDPHLLSDPDGECLVDDEGGCEFDDDCWEGHKCCKTKCGYSDCVKVSSSTGKTEMLKRLLNLLEAKS